ncbi:LmbE family N-acetylglucosaminyl deacetylase [Rhizobium sp. SG570]|nr:LmbE family N-acetylglucosaminyl deacetylase [Rhizobium sp. SG570]NRP87963.1 4-oxalmesaconate hydratase [Ensifer adhaerens]
MLLTSYRAACGAGYKVTVVCLSLDERGESAKLRKQPGMTLERVKAAQRAESEKAAKALGVYDLISFDLGDYPLRLTDEDKYCLADVISYRTSGGPDGGFLDHDEGGHQWGGNGQDSAKTGRWPRVSYAINLSFV